MAEDMFYLGGIVMADISYLSGEVCDSVFALCDGLGASPGCCVQEPR